MYPRRDASADANKFGRGLQDYVYMASAVLSLAVLSSASGDVECFNSTTTPQPWHLLSASCSRLMACALLGFATACTEEHLTMASESDVLCRAMQNGAAAGVRGGAVGLRGILRWIAWHTKKR